MWIIRIASFAILSGYSAAAFTPSIRSSSYRFVAPCDDARCRQHGKGNLQQSQMAKKQRFEPSKGFGKKSSPSPSSVPTNDYREDDEDGSSSLLTGGQKALANLRNLDSERKAKEFQSFRELAEEKDSPATIPDPVAQRMGKRMLPFVGIPLFGGIAAFATFWYLATVKHVEFPPIVVGGSTLAFWAIGLLGITYSVMSASWDPEEEGTALGMDQFKTNIDNVTSGLKRSRKNALLREKMEGLSEKDMEQISHDVVEKKQQ